MRSVIRRRVYGVGSLVPPVSGPYAWFRSDTGLWQDSAKTIKALADNDPVGAWSDIGGSGRDILQATNGNRPTLKTNILNSLPAVLFNSATPTWLASATGLTGPQPWTMGIVVNWTALSGANYQITGGLYGGTAQGGGGAAGGGQSRSHIRAWGGDNKYGVSTTTSEILSSAIANTDQGSFHYFTANFDNQNGIATSLYRQGTQIIAPGSTGIAGYAQIIIGKPDYAGDYMNGYIVEVLIYPSILGSTDRATMERYFALRYGL